MALMRARNLGGRIRGLRGRDRTVGDFWKWGYSNLLPNITRGVFAEYLVAVALRQDGEPRKDGTFDAKKGYRGDVYVLCCLKGGADEETVTDMSRWEFWVLAQNELVTNPERATTRVSVRKLEAERTSVD